MHIDSSEEVITRGDITEKQTVKDWLSGLIDVEKVKPFIMERLDLLNTRSNFVEDERQSIKYADRLFEYYSANHPDKLFTEQERRIVRIGLIFSDIGKTGPLKADALQQDLVIRLFKVENVQDPKITIGKLIRDKFPDSADEDINLLKDMGLSEEAPIERLWRLHSGWSKEIIENDGVPADAIPAVALHHILEGDNENLIDEKGKFKDGFGGSNGSFDRAEKLVVILDKYDAFISRRGFAHEESLKRVLKIVNGNKRFENDPEFLELIQDLGVALTPEMEQTNV